MTSKAFDMALFIPPDPMVGEAVEVEDVFGPEQWLKTTWANYLLAPPGVHVDASIPAATIPGQTLVAGDPPDFPWEAALQSVPGLPVATAQGQVLTAGPAPGFAWEADNPPSTVPAPPATNGQFLMSQGGAWVIATPAQIMNLGNAVLKNGQNITANDMWIKFDVMGLMGMYFRLDGTDPALSGINNFTIDCGTY